METVNTKTLDTEHWQHKRGTIGGVVTDFEDIEQCLETICTTAKGTVIHNPNLGLPIMDFLDKPLNIVAPQLRQMFKEELEYQEPRVGIKSVALKANEDGLLIIKISYVYENILRTKEVITQWRTA